MCLSLSIYTSQLLAVTPQSQDVSKAGRQRCAAGNDNKEHAKLVPASKRVLLLYQRMSVANSNISSEMVGDHNRSHHCTPHAGCCTVVSCGQGAEDLTSNGTRP